MDQKKTTMSVPEMRRMLGLRKTDSYWLVHKQCFEHWYANQVKYKNLRIAFT